MNDRSRGIIYSATGRRYVTEGLVRLNLPCGSIAFLT